jgi:hypothetical protein
VPTPTVTWFCDNVAVREGPEYQLELDTSEVYSKQFRAEVAVRGAGTVVTDDCRVTVKARPALRLPIEVSPPGNNFRLGEPVELRVQGESHDVRAMVLAMALGLCAFPLPLRCVDALSLSASSHPQSCVSALFTFTRLESDPRTIDLFAWSAVPAAVASQSLRYQWYRDGTALDDDARDSAYVILALSDAENGDYMCIVTGSRGECGGLVSPRAVLRLTSPRAVLRSTSPRAADTRLSMLMMR